MKPHLRLILILLASLWLPGPAWAAITGQWSFENPDLFLSAKIGQPIQAIDLDTELAMAFGTSGQGSFADVPPLNGKPVKFLKFPVTAPSTGGFIVPHSAAPNGGGSYINQYTIIMDVYYPTSSSGKRRALFQTDLGLNADFLINEQNQVGADGSVFDGNLTPNAWHRVAIAVDLIASSPTAAVFIDGVKVGERTVVSAGQALDGRFAIIGDAFYFDNDDDGETQEGLLSSLQFRDERVPDAVLVALGGPSAEGILTGPIPNPYVFALTPSPETAIFPERSTVPPRPLIQAVIVDGTNALDPATVTMTVDTGAVAPEITQQDGTNWISFTPTNFYGPLSTHTVRVAYKDFAGNNYASQWQFVVGQFQTLPPGSARPLASAGTPGLVVRSAQAPVDVGILNLNSLTRAVQQLNGTLLDTTGALVANVANPGPNSDGSYDVDVINFHQDSSEYGLFVGDTSFPGIPGSEGYMTNYAVEVTAYLELTAGIHHLGVTACTDRTDTGTDDNYTMFGGNEARDYLAPVLGSFFRGKVSPFAATFTTNDFTILAPETGLYSFRLVFWQVRDDSSLEWYSMDEETGDRILINDPADARAIKAYRNSTAPAANRPYIAEINPRPGASGVSSALPIEVLLVDDDTTVNLSSVKLSLNNTVVSHTTASDGGRTWVRYQPNATRPNPTNQLQLVYSDSQGNFSTNNWSFTIAVNTQGENNITGQWDFDSGNLVATVGKDLRYLDGPSGATATKTRFGLCSELGVALIDGQDARVMYVPGDTGEGSRNIGYIMEHLIPPNGGGTRVNQYTLIMDVMVGTTGAGAASLIQISSLDNTDDGDLFWQGSSFGQGGGDGYAGTGAFTPGVWHRVAIAYDEAANPPVATKYVDGIKQDDWMDNQALDHDRRALKPTAILFADGDQDERREWWVNCVQIRAGKMTDAQLAALGGPAASGIPQVIQPTTVSGQWDFNQGTLAATVGKNLLYLDGDNGTTATKTRFGLCSELGVALIDGQDARVMYVPGDTGEGSRNIGYIMEHLIPPNGGGTRVNQYTLIMDVMVGTTGAGAASLIQISSLDNTDDGDLFWQGSSFGQGGGDGYAGTGAFIPGEWHRVAIAYDEAANPPVATKYVDGIKQDDWMDNQALDHDRRALKPTAILFADGDQDERREWWVNCVQIRAGKMTDAELAALGGASAGGIPIVVPKSSVTGQWDFNQGTLAATVGKNLLYLDGDNGTTATKTRFGLCSELGVALIDGQDARVMYVPGDTGEGSRNIGYIMEHLIPPNGGGTRVNQYTLIMDVMVGTTGAGAASLIQISSLDNTDDGDLFWQGSSFGQGGGDGYAGTGAFTPGEWHRVAIAYDEAANPPLATKFVDGIFQDDWMDSQALDHDRRALKPTAILFADGDQDERREWWVNSVQIRAGALSKEELASLGGPSAAGIPIVLAVSSEPEPQPEVQVGWTDGQLTITWPASATGYSLESSPSLVNPDWQLVPNVTGNTATVPVGDPTRFYRLRK